MEAFHTSAGNSKIIWMKTDVFQKKLLCLSVTNHFPHDSCSNVFCSHFFHVISEGLLDKDHEHHANQSNNTDLNKKKDYD